jgi:ubiquitin carboxyl-terminal hydrolase 7
MLQFTQGPVSTKDLTRSFGWDTMDAFQQHDVQELNRILCDRLEEKMKGTRVEGTINKLFEGHFTNYIECINIDYKSLRREAFQDLQLVVKGCNSIYDSFKEYCQVEILEGENKYEAEGHGKQDARRGVLFESLPPVLNLHLRRFEYDYERDLLVKV